MDLRVLADADDRTRPLIWLNGKSLPVLRHGDAHAPADTRKLCAASASLAFFADMALELRSIWARAHAELCAEATPHIVPNNALLFEGLKALARPILLLSGRAVLLTQQSAAAPRDARALCELGPGDLLAPASLTWLQPLACSAVAHGEVTYLALPERPFATAVKLPHLQLLARRAALLRRLPLLTECDNASLRALAYLARGETRPAFEPIIAQGSACDGLRVLAAGSCKATARRAR